MLRSFEVKKLTTIIGLVLSGDLYAQENNYFTIPIVHDTAIQWMATADKVINLTPREGVTGLKKWYLGKIRKGQVTAYTDEGNYFSSYTLSMPSLETQEWLKGLSIELPGYTNPKEWYFFDKTIANDNYDRYKYRVGALQFSDDTCCGCDEADAFRAKQVLRYKNGRFSIYNQYISLLCARQTGKTPIEWYPLCNLAYNDKPDRKFPGPGNDVVLLNTDVVEYDFNRQYPSPFDSVLTIYQTDIGSLIYQDILKGKIKTVNTETGEPIPVSELLTLSMATDTIAVYDDDERYKVTAYKIVQQERSAADLSRLRITQDFYFDFKNERLYSVVRSVVILLVMRFDDGGIRGTKPFCRLE